MDPRSLTIEKIQHALENHRYICERSLATAVYLSITMGKPVLLEGEAGVGKTEVAKVLAEALDTRLIRLQCYEGLDVNTALYEWNYPKQMLRIKLEEIQHGSREAVESAIFTEEYLIKRPLLEAIQSDAPMPPVLLIDESIARTWSSKPSSWKSFPTFKSPFRRSGPSAPDSARTCS